MNPEAQDARAAIPAGQTIIIIGAGQAGGWAAQTLRQEGFTGRVVLVGDEPHPPHERPPLSKAVLAGDVVPESVWLFKTEAFDALDIDWRPDTRVTRIDREAKRIDIAGGESLTYDKLILCTGGSARTLAVPGVEDATVHTLRRIEDALALAPALRPGRSVVVIGGGWIGLEVAATARKKGAEVTVVEAQDRLCQRSVPPVISEHLLALHRSHGTEVLLGKRIERLGKTVEGRSLVTLTDGTALECDAIVAGVGLVPHDRLARDAGLVCDGGVVVDAACRTSDPDILAAGDVAVTPNRWLGGHVRLESWQNAQEQGIAAARSAMGATVEYHPLPWFWTDQYDMNLQICGQPAVHHQVVARGNPDAESFVLFYLEGKSVKAAIGRNAARELRFARRLIEQEKPVDVAKLADPDVPMAKV